MAASVGINLDNNNNSSTTNNGTTSRIETIDLSTSVSGNTAIYIPDDTELLALADRVVHEADAAEIALHYLTKSSSTTTTTHAPNSNDTTGTNPPAALNMTSPISKSKLSSSSSASSSPSFTSPSIPGKVQAVKLKTTLQLLAHRTATLHAAVEAIKVREHTLDEREKGLNALVTRVEELAKREEALQRNIEVLQAITDQSTLKSPVKLNTFADQEKQWKNSLRGSSTPSGTPNPNTVIPPTTPLSPSSYLTPPVSTTSSGSSGTGGGDHALSMRVSLETREHSLQEREKILNEREQLLKTKEETMEAKFAKEKEERLNEMNTMITKMKNETTTLASNGRTELDTLRASLLAEQERNQTLLKEEQAKVQTEKENVQELLRQTKEMDKTIQSERTMLGRARDEIANRNQNLEKALNDFAVRQAEFAKEAAEREQGLLSLAETVNEQRTAYETERQAGEKELQRLRNQLETDQEKFTEEQNRIRELFEEEQEHFRNQSAEERNQIQLLKEKNEKEATVIRNELTQHLLEVEMTKKKITIALSNAQEAEASAREHAAAVQELQRQNEAERAANAVTTEKLRKEALDNEQSRHQLLIEKAAVQTLELQMRDQQQHQEEELRLKENQLLVRQNDIQAREQELLVNEQKSRQTQQTVAVERNHEVEEKTQEIGELRKEIQTLQERLVQQREEMSKQTVLPSNTAEVAKLTDTLMQYQDQNRQDQETIRRLTSTIDTLQGQLQSTKDELVTAQTKAVVIPSSPSPSKETNTFEQERTALATEQANLRTRAEKVQHQEEILNKLKAELSHENEKRKSQEAMLDAKSNKLATAFQELQNRREALEARVKEVTAEAVQRTADLKTKEDELRKKEETIKEREQQITLQLQSSVPSTTNSNVMDPSYHNPEDEQLINQLTNVCKQLEERLGDAKMTAMEANSSRDHAIQEKQNALREQFTLTTKYDTVLQRLEHTENENTGLKDQVRKLETAMENAAARAHRLEEEIQAGRDGAAQQLAKQLDTLQKENQSKDTVIVTNQHRIDELVNENNKYKVNYTELVKNNQQLANDNQDYQQQLRKYKQTIAAATIARWLRQQRLHAIRSAFHTWERTVLRVSTSTTGTIVETGSSKLLRPSVQVPDSSRSSPRSGGNSIGNSRNADTSVTPATRSVNSGIFSPSSFPSAPPPSLVTPTTLTVSTVQPIHPDDDAAFNTHDETFSGGGFDFSAGSFDFSAGGNTNTTLPTVDEERDSPVRASPDTLVASSPNTGINSTEKMNVVMTPLSKNTSSSENLTGVLSPTFSTVNNYTPVSNSTSTVVVPPSSSSSSSMNIPTGSINLVDASPEFIVCSICSQSIPFDEVRHHSDICYVRNKRTNSITHGTPHHGSSGVSGLVHGVTSALRRVSHTNGGTTPGTNSRSRSSTSEDSSNVPHTTTSNHTHPKQSSMLLPSFSSLGGVGIRSTNRSRKNSIQGGTASSTSSLAVGSSNTNSSVTNSSTGGAEEWMDKSIPMMSLDEFSHAK